MDLINYAYEAFTHRVRLKGLTGRDKGRNWVRTRSKRVPFITIYHADLGRIWKPFGGVRDDQIIAIKLQSLGNPANKEHANGPDLLLPSLWVRAVNHSLTITQKVTPTTPQTQRQQFKQDHNHYSLSYYTGVPCPWCFVCKHEAIVVETTMQTALSCHGRLLFIAI